MGTYELVTIHKPEAETGAVQKEIAAVIEAVDGTIDATDAWGDRKFTYHIEGYANGSYTVFDVSLPEDKVDEVFKQLGFVEEILRTRIYKKDTV